MDIDQLKSDIEALVDYNWSDERKDYEDNLRESDHIFNTLVRLDNFINGTDREPTDYVRDGLETDDET